MRFVIAFDTFYGNTRMVEKYLASEPIKHGHDAVLVDMNGPSHGRLRETCFFSGRLRG